MSQCTHDIRALSKHVAAMVQVHMNTVDAEFWRLPQMLGRYPKGGIKVAHRTFEPWPAPFPPKTSFGGHANATM